MPDTDICQAWLITLRKTHIESSMGFINNSYVQLPFKEVEERVKLCVGAPSFDDARMAAIGATATDHQGYNVLQIEMMEGVLHYA